MTLRVCCVHGKWEACGRALARYTSNIESLNHSVTCPGGREPTVEEITQWLKERGYVPLDVQTFGETWDRGES